jgi:hypothetical protein
MGVFSNPFRRKSEGLPPWAALDQETLRISAAMQHVQQHGNLDAFPGGQNEKLALMLTASRQGLVTWNREHQRYELTNLGHERLGMREALRDPGSPDLPRSSPGSGRRFALGTGTMVAGIAGLLVGATAMALIAGNSSKTPSRDREAVTASVQPADPKSADEGTTSHTQTTAQPAEQQQASQNPAVAPNPAVPSATPPSRPNQTAAKPQPPNANPPPATATPPQPDTSQAPAAPHPQQAENAAGSPVQAPSSPSQSATPAKSGQPASANDSQPVGNAQAGRAAAKAGVGSGSGNEGSRSQASADHSLAGGADASDPHSGSHGSSPSSTAETKPSPASKRPAAGHTATHKAQPRERATAAEQSGYGQQGQSSSQQSTVTNEKSSGKTAKSRNRQEARQAAREKRRSDRSRREYAKEDSGEPSDGMMFRRYENGPPVLVMPRREYERRLREEDRPQGYAYENPPFGYRDRPRGFGPFDWLFR